MTIDMIEAFRLGMIAMAEIIFFVLLIMAFGEK